MPPPPAPTRRWWWPVACLCAAVAALCHMWWVAESISPSTLPTRTSYVSELFATDQPWSSGFRAVEIVAGAMVCVGVAAAWVVGSRARQSFGRGIRRSLAAAQIGLAVWGLGSIGDALSPMSCAPSADRECAAAEMAGTLPFHHQFHSVTSTVATVGMLVGLGTLWVLAVVEPARVSRRRRRLASTAVAALAVATIWVVAEMVSASLGPLHTGTGAGASGHLGWAQRVQVTLSAVCLLLVALSRPRDYGVRV